MPLQSIRIRQYTFHIDAPFQAGHCLTEGEAQALNRLRAENIRNNFAKAILDEIGALPDGTMLGAEALASLQVRLAAYASTYQFQTRHVPKPLDPLVSEIEAIVGELKVQAENLDGASPDDSTLAKWRQDPRVAESARARIQARARSSSAALMELV